jgi:hypothetical protein
MELMVKPFGLDEFGRKVGALAGALASDPGAASHRPA